MDEASVRMLTEASGCSPEEARISLEATDGDIRQAAELLSLVKKEILYIKCIFTGRQHLKTRGTFIIVADGPEGKMLELELLITHSTKEMALDIDAEWRAFMRNIQQLESDLRINSSLAHSLEEELQKNLRAGKLNRFYRQVLSGKTEEVFSLFADLIEENIGERVDCQFDADLLSRLQYDQNLAQNQEPQQKAEEEERESASKSELNIFLQSEPEIAPVKGKKPGELEIGDQILVRITDERDVGRYLNYLLGGRGKHTNRPVPAEIIDKEITDSKRFRLQLRFGPGIFGTTQLEPEIRIQQTADGKSGGEIGKYFTSELGLALLFLVISIILLILLLRG